MLHLDFEPEQGVTSIYLLEPDEIELNYELDNAMEEYFSRYFNTSRDLHTLEAEERALACLRK